MAETISPEFSINVNIPKAALLVIVILFAIIAQIQFIRQELVTAIECLVLVILTTIVYFTKKDNSFKFELRLEKGIKLLFILIGLACVLAGWFWLLKPTREPQYVGVVLTTIGCVLAYFGLPNVEIMDDKKAGKQGSMTAEEAEILATSLKVNETDILFKNFDFLNNYAVKGALMAAALIVLYFANKLLYNPAMSMTAVGLYGCAGALVFFAFPLMKFSVKPAENRVMDIIKLVAILAAFFIAYLGQVQFVKGSLGAAVRYFIAAAVIFIMAMPVYQEKEPEENDKFPAWLEFVCFGLIFVAAIYLRVWDLGARPFGMENDEAGGFLNLVVGDEHRTVGNLGIFNHLAQLGLQIFSDQRIALKFMGVSVGILAIPALYFMIRLAFNPRVAIFTTAIFAILRWNVYYSRYGQYGEFTVLAEILAIYFILLAFKQRKKSIWFLAGLAVGFTWHGIMTSWLIIIPCFLYLFLKSVSNKGFFKAHMISIIAFMLGFWIFSSMIVHNYFISKSMYFSRISEVSVFSKDPNAPNKNVGKGIMDNTVLVLKMFNHQGDSRQRNSGGSRMNPPWISGPPSFTA